MRKSEHILFEKQPAMNFNEAYPIGNGSLGGMVYGDFPKMRLGLNHDEIWSGDRNDSYEVFDKNDFIKARELTMEGKYFEATNMISHQFSKQDSSCYLTLGDLYFDFEYGEINDYRRELDIRTSQANIRFLLNGKEVHISYIVSYPHKAIFAHIEAEDAINLAISASIPLETSRIIDGERLMILGECPIESQTQKKNKSLPKNLEGKKGVAFATAISAVSNGCVETNTDAIKVKRATRITAVFTTVTSFKDGYAHRNDNYITQARDICTCATEAKYEEVLSRHIADVTHYFDRVNISLGDRDRSDIPTSERIDTFEDENGELDCDLITLAFNYGRYLLIASSREGSNPANLQGIWNDIMNPPWSSNYTTNINLQMNYWHALTCDLPELFEPLERYANIAAENGEKCARYMYGADGFTVHHNSDIFGTAAPAYGNTRWLFFPVGGSWIVSDLYRKYEYTLDKGYLCRIYPLLEGNVRFILDMLVDDGDYLVIAPATSPENMYWLDGELCSVARGTTMFGALTREGIANFLNASRVLGIHNELTERAEVIYPRLLPIRITDDGRIEEWYFGRESVNITENDITHRHLSHLYDLYPAHNIIPDNHELASAAKKSLDVRGDENTCWSIAWRICCRARLGDSEAIMNLLRLFFFHAPSEERSYFQSEANNAKWGIYTNMLSCAPPFQIDANFGFAAALCEILVGERNGEPIPLPALPRQIPSGSIRGLRVRGNRRVDMDFSDCKVTNFKVY